MPTFLGITMSLTALSLIVLVLAQKARGGGLASALDGRGGLACWGPRAGSTITWVTLAVAAWWIGLCLVAVKVLGHVGY